MAVLDMISLMQSPSLASIIGKLENYSGPVESGKSNIGNTSSGKQATSTNGNDKKSDDIQHDSSSSATTGKIVKHWHEFLETIKDTKTNET